MRKTILALVVLVIFSIGAMAYAETAKGGKKAPAEKSEGCGGCGMMGGGPMWRGNISAEDQKIFDDTAELRKDFHGKMFDYKEAMRKGDYKKAEELDKELTEVKAKLKEKGFEPGMGKFGKGGCGKGPGGKGKGKGGCGGPCGGGRGDWQ